MHSRAEVIIDIPIPTDGAAPPREQDDVQDESARGVEGGEGHDEPRQAGLHQLQHACEEGDEGEFGSPKGDVDEEERDPRDVKEVGG